MFRSLFTTLIVMALLSMSSLASSHSEAPLISVDRFADNTDVYAFRSLEPGREGFVTLIANYIPFQEPSGGPQYYRFDDNVRYEIKIDNTGDGREDLIYRFTFNTNTVNDATVFGMSTFNQNAIITSLDDPDYNQFQTYTVERIDNRLGRRPNKIRGRYLGVGLKTPPSNIGLRTTPDYETNLGQPAVYDLPNGGKVFVGQRDEAFYVDLGAIFDTFNIGNTLFGGVDTTQGFNISTIALEVPIEELTQTNLPPTSPTDPDAVIGVWATASRRSIRVLDDGNTRIESGDWKQVSRLGNPLVNEVVIPLGLKDKFNGSTPREDVIFAPSVVDPELARIFRDFFALTVPSPPRQDLVSIFATGIPVNSVTGPNYTTFLSDGQPHEYLRLNVAIPPTPIAQIDRLGLLGGDVAGFPNGRRVQDDVVDIALRVVAGGTPFTPATNDFPNNVLGDGVGFNPEGPLLSRFPYLLPPTPGGVARTSNQTQLGVRESVLPVVDERGLFKMKNK
ncbi:MAG: DUF4331 domain-containing protein [Pyrinomonadaceae bacterium]